MKTGLTKKQKEILMDLARNTIAHDLGLEELKFSDADFKDKIFQEKRGVFVTLETHGNLRGCIGNIEPVYPLYEAVKMNAHEAAFEDPRFDALAADEFSGITIEISILTVPKKLEFNNPDDLIRKLKPGKDGVILGKGFFKATYLPQVWDEIKEPEFFLSSLAMKAGLDPDIWKNEKIDISVYQVEKFNKKDLS
jgi:AmmeMemoRadiSam system protein A